MTMLITDPLLERELRARREASGADRYDEVWEGIYMMAPMPNDEHQQVVTNLASILSLVVAWRGNGEVRAGVNVSDRENDWRLNYRVPDVAVFSKGGRARNRGSHWVGGPDFVVEVVSHEDKTRDKLAFYQSVGVKELLIVDRDPWRLELYREGGGSLVLIGQCTVAGAELLQSGSVPLSFGLEDGPTRPQIRVRGVSEDQNWLI